MHGISYIKVGVISEVMCGILLINVGVISEDMGSISLCQCV